VQRCGRDPIPRSFCHKEAQRFTKSIQIVLCLFVAIPA
jgi:hypothetical protein